LINSIILAKKIEKGEITFNNHLNYHNNVLKKKINRLEDFQEVCDKETLKENKTNKLLNRKRAIKKLKFRKSDNKEGNFSHLKNKISNSHTISQSNYIRLENKMKQVNEIKNEIHSSGLNKNLITILNELYDILIETEEKCNIYSVSLLFYLDF
jgi:hypothetical protein